VAALQSVQAEVIEHWKFEDVPTGQALMGEMGINNPNLVRGTTGGGSTYKDCSFATGYSGQGLSFASGNVASFGTTAYDTSSSLLAPASFKVEAYINPAADLADGAYSTLIANTDLGSTTVVSYEIGLVGTASGTYLQGMFSNADGTQSFSETFDGAAVTAGAWSYVSVWFDTETMQLTLQLGENTESYLSTITPAGDAGSETFFSLGQRKNSDSWIAGTEYVGLMDEVTVSAIPEPVSVGLLGLGAALLFIRRRFSNR
jgi:hypothetical protein